MFSPSAPGRRTALSGKWSMRLTSCYVSRFLNTCQATDCHTLFETIRHRSYSYVGEKTIILAKSTRKVYLAFQMISLYGQIDSIFNSDVSLFFSVYSKPPRDLCRFSGR